MGYYMRIPDGAYHCVTALDHCAWPNLTMMPNGEIAAVIYSHPSHGWHEGDPELWVSSDGGYTWQCRAQVTQHQPPTVRMNVAAGLNPHGHLLALVGGWTLQGEESHGRGQILKPWVSISIDGGYSFQHIGELAPEPEEVPGFSAEPVLVPFGDVCVNGDECLVACYGRPDGVSGHTSVLLRSPDGGCTWGDASLIGEHYYGETALLVTSRGRWLALSRTSAVQTADPGVNLPSALRLAVSEDQGRSWQWGQYLSLPGQIPGHLLELSDGRILATYGSRIPGFRGICGKVSEDLGETWSHQFVIVGGLLEGDMGYPSSVQVQGGEIVTAYYANCAPWHQRYHMAVVRYQLDVALEACRPDHRSWASGRPAWFESRDRGS